MNSKEKTKGETNTEVEYQNWVSSTCSSANCASMDRSGNPINLT